MTREAVVPGVEALARAMFFEHQHVPGEGDLSWDSLDGRSRAAWLDSGQTTLAALSPADRLAIAGPEFGALLSAVTDDRHWDRLPARIRSAAQPFLPTADDVLGILTTPVTPEGGER